MSEKGPTSGAPADDSKPSENDTKTDEDAVIEGEEFETLEQTGEDGPPYADDETTDDEYYYDTDANEEDEEEIEEVALAEATSLAAQLIDAVYHNPNQESVTRLLKLNQQLIHFRDGEGRTVLHYAAWAGNPEIVAQLIQAGADKDAQDDEGLTPLHLAANFGRIDVVDMLLELGAKIDAEDTIGQTPLHFAAMEGQSEVAKLLISKNADIEKATKEEGCTPLHYAALFRKNEVLDVLIGANADINKKESKGRTPLDLARAVENNAIIVDTLARAQAGPGPAQGGPGPAQGHPPSSQLSASSAEPVQGQPQTASQRRQNPEPPERAAPSASPVTSASNAGHPPNPSPAPSQATEVDKDALGVELLDAVYERDLSHVEDLIRRGANLNHKDENEYTPLHYAAYFGLKDIVQKLIEAKANIDAKDNEGQTPLHCAAIQGHNEVANVLILANAKIDAEDNIGQTPLHLAVENGQKELVLLLINKGANKEAIDTNGLTPLYLAASLGNKEVVQVLLENGANKDFKNKDGVSPLHVAAINGHEEVVKLLLEAKSPRNVNDKDNWGHTPLHWAANAGQIEVVKLLIAQGADINAVNKNGDTPSDLARQQGHNLIVAHLEKEALKKSQMDGKGLFNKLSNLLSTPSAPKDGETPADKEPSGKAAVINSSTSESPPEDLAEVPNTSISNVINILDATDPEKKLPHVKGYKKSDDQKSVKIKIDDGPSVYAKQNDKGGVSVSVKKSFFGKGKDKSLEVGVKLAVAAAQDGGTIRISPHLSESQKEQAYNMITEELRKNGKTKVQIEGYKPQTTADIVVSNPKNQ